jgi:hypothetical protein
MVEEAAYMETNPKSPILGYGTGMTHDPGFEC